jgi:hypothetical protein
MMIQVAKTKGRLRMKLKVLLTAVAIMVNLAFAGCHVNQSGTTSVNSGRSQTSDGKTPSALPDNGFRALITIDNAPAKLRAGEKAIIQVKIKNASDVLWYARGAQFNASSDNKFYLAAGNRWLGAMDEKLVTDMDGRYGLGRDLRPGEETEVPLAVTAPKDPGEYLLEVDLVQEQVAWFHDKGSPTAKTKITVVR